jgi:hypothetical protein
MKNSDRTLDRASNEPLLATLHVKRERGDRSSEAGCGSLERVSAEVETATRRSICMNTSSDQRRKTNHFLAYTRLFFDISHHNFQPSN